MVNKYFGTDGVRGTANCYPMTPDMALKIGMAAGKVFTCGDHRHTVVIGKDTRLSGYMFEPALVSGFVGMGMDVILLGPLPTPAVAMMTRSLRADLGVMISASHNQYSDNGIKFFGPDGYKLSDEKEHEIEGLIDEGVEKWLVDPSKLGRAKRLEDAEGRYIEFAKNTFPKGLRLDGLKIVIDCAHGAAYKVAPAALWELGADVIKVGAAPDGFNINRECGSTNTKLMKETVLENNADIGIALDGDADRVVIANEKGKLVDGDQLMAVIARSWSESGRLRGSGVVATVMSNLGLEKFLDRLGLRLVRAQVGDRYVVESMLESMINVGGEQSGHIILHDYNSTGDGLVAALQTLAVIVSKNAPASEVCSVFKPVPQILRNVYFDGVEPLKQPQVKRAIEIGRKMLGANGRLLIRLSGTEPVLRIMAEGEDKNLVGDVVEKISVSVTRGKN